MGFNYVFPTRYTADSVISLYKRINNLNGRTENMAISAITALVSAAGYDGYFIVGYNEYYRWIRAFHLSTDNDLYCADQNYPNVPTGYNLGTYAGTDIDFSPLDSFAVTVDNTLYQSGTANENTTPLDNRNYYGFSNLNTNDPDTFPTILVLINVDNTVYLNNVNVTPVVYNWDPVEQLAGNEGQFRMNLSQVKKAYIGDGLTQDSTSDGSRFVISDMALLRTLTNNCAVDDEVTVAYCGRNYLTFTRNSSDTRSGIFKFYYYNGLLAYTSPLFVVNPGTTTFVYLCMYKDVVEHAAMMQIISYYVANDPYYTYNHLYDTYGATAPTDDDMIKLWIWLSDNGNIEEDINPYDTGTTDDGGDPGNPRPQDKINDSPLPTLSGLESGIVTLYRPTATQLTQISAFLWSNDVLDNFKKYFNNFADNILSLSIMPFTPSGLSTKYFKVGNMQSVDIGQVEYSTQRFFDIPMGSVNINKLWGSYLDYSPYTKCEIYLPYLGLHSLDIDELMSPCKLDGSMPATQGCTLTLTYRLDILTGVIVAKIAVTNEFISNQIRYQFSGKCGASIPLTGQTYAQLVQSMATIGAGLISTVATSGMAAPMIAGAAAVAATVQSQKPSVERIGNISGDASMLATNVPYIILSSPNKALLDKQEEFTGFPSYKSGTLQNFTGYCEVIEAHVEGITCTEEERAEILSLLKAGVII